MPWYAACATCFCILTCVLLSLQLMRVLARLALLPRAGVQVCRAFDIEDFVCVDHRMRLGKKMFCRALLKLRAVGHALAPDAPYPAVTEEEAVGA